MTIYSISAATQLQTARLVLQPFQTAVKDLLFGQ